MSVYVVLFNVGTDNEGIHSIRIGDQHQVLMFESEDDAIRFGILLEAQDSPTPTVEAIEREEIEEICCGCWLRARIYSGRTARNAG